MDSPRKVPDFYPREIAARFEYRGVLGAGAMGQVFLAWDVVQGQEVAIKVMAEKLDFRAERRFLREAEVLEKLDHPNVLRIYSHGYGERGPYIVMERLRGLPLGAEPLLDPLGVMVEVSAGLAAVHEAGLLHRDVKPDNIVLAEGDRPVLIDFGLAYDPDDDSVTRTGEVMGTLAYMAPERIRRAPASVASDWYAWALTLYRLIEGHVPYSFQDLLDAAAGKPLAPLRFESIPDDGPVADTIRRVADPDPDARPAERGLILGLLGMQAPALRIRPAAAPAPVDEEDTYAARSPPEARPLAPRQVRALAPPSPPVGPPASAPAGVPRSTLLGAVVLAFAGGIGLGFGLGYGLFSGAEPARLEALSPTPARERVPLPVAPLEAEPPPAGVTREPSVRAAPGGRPGKEVVAAAESPAAAPSAPPPSSEVPTPPAPGGADPESASEPEPGEPAAARVAAAPEDDPAVALAHGLRLLLGDGREADPAAGCAWILDAAMGEAPGAVAGLAGCLTRGVLEPARVGDAIETLRAAALGGDVDARWALVQAWLDGRELPEDPPEVLRWMEHAANHHGVEVEYRLGMELLNGRFGEGREAEAARWFERAAQAGDPDAANNLGVLHDKGRGVSKDAGAAARWYERAIAAGHAGALYNLGALVEAGRAPGYPEASARDYYRRAAAAGVEAARQKLGEE